MFRSLYTRYEQSEKGKNALFRPWPATYRNALPDFKLTDYTLTLNIPDSNLSKSFNWKQLMAFPYIAEPRNITSKSGWTYQGHWKGIALHSLLNQMPSSHAYPWVCWETLSGEQYYIERERFLNYRLIYECDESLLTPLYGGPFMAIRFDHYIEYAFPHLKSLSLPKGDHQLRYPNQDLGFSPQEAVISAGRYYAIHQERLIQIER